MGTIVKWARQGAHAMTMFGGGLSEMMKSTMVHKEIFHLVLESLNFEVYNFRCVTICGGGWILGINSWMTQTSTSHGGSYQRGNQFLKKKS